MVQNAPLVVTFNGMAREQKKEFRTSVILTKDQQERLGELATRNDTSIAWVIRQAINKYLDRQPGRNGSSKEEN